MVKKKKSLWVVRQLVELKQWAGKHKFWAGVAFIVVFSLLLSTGQIAVERYNYYRVGNLLEDVLATLPDGEKSERKIETINRCGRGSAKFSAGPLRCSVGKKATYRFSEFDNPDQVYPEIYEHINNRPYVEKDTIYSGLRLGPFNLKPGEVKNSMFDELGSSIKLSRFTDFSCSLSFKPQHNIFEVSVLCGKDAKLEYFKIPDS